MSDKENETASEEEESSFTPMSFSKEIFDSIYTAVESLASSAIKLENQMSEVGEILSQLDARIEKLENNE